MGEISLEFLAEQVRRLLDGQAQILDGQARIHDEFLVFGARVDRVESGITLLTFEVRAIRNELGRFDTRIKALEERGHA
jgi:hypothetical protein